MLTAKRTNIFYDFLNKRNLSGRKLVFLTAGLIAAVFLLCLLPAEKSYAAASPYCAKNVTAYFYNPDENVQGIENYSRYIYIKNLSKKAVITKLKCSRKEIIVNSSLNQPMQQLRAIEISCVDLSLSSKYKALKSGDKAKITFTVKQNGKSYNLSCNVTFKKVPAIMKTLQVGSQNITKTVRGTDCAWLNTDAAKVKVEYAAVSGYRINRVLAEYNNRDKGIRVKNGQMIEVKDLSAIHIFYTPVKKPVNYQTPIRWKEIDLDTPRQGLISVFVN